MKTLAAILLSAVCAGCATVTVSHDRRGIKVEGGETPIETVMVENTGWILFNAIPIASGNPNKPGKCSCCIFKDTTTLQNNLDMLEREMIRAGATRIANLYSKTSDENIFFLLFTRTACRTSAVLLK